jgi:ketosteroid isomerase-like protein
VTAASRPAAADPRAAQVVAFFESLSPGALEHLGDVYAAEAWFKDPFNEVRGVPAIREVFEHMYRALDGPHFIVHEAVTEGDQCFLTWDFRFRFRRFTPDLQTVRGASHLRFDAQGRIAMHRDYWDVAEELYEKLPAVGALMRWLKARARS